MGTVVSEEKSFEIVDGRTMEPAYTISSPVAFGSGELKIEVILIICFFACLLFFKVKFFKVKVFLTSA